jgi:hypothetical protein
MSEKVFNEWLSRLEEGVRFYTIHKNNDWLEQMQLSRKALKKIFKEQQKVIEKQQKEFEELEKENSAMRRVIEDL